MNLSKIQIKSEFNKYRSSREKVSQVWHSSPDLCCAVHEILQVNEGRFNFKHVRAVNKLIRRAKLSVDMILKYHELDMSSF